MQELSLIFVLLVALARNSSVPQINGALGTQWCSIDADRRRRNGLLIWPAAQKIEVPPRNSRTKSVASEWFTAREGQICHTPVTAYILRNGLLPNTECQWQVPGWKWSTMDGTMSCAVFAPVPGKAETFFHPHPEFLGLTPSLWHLFSSPRVLLEWLICSHLPTKRCLNISIRRLQGRIWEEYPLTQQPDSLLLTPIKIPSPHISVQFFICNCTLLSVGYILQSIQMLNRSDQVIP